MMRYVIIAALFAVGTSRAFVPQGATRLSLAHRLPSPPMQSGLKHPAPAHLAVRGGSVIISVAGRDAACAAVGLVGASAWLKIWTTLASADLVDPKVSRKIVHSGSAPLFLLTWPFFTTEPAARVVAAAVPAVFMVRLLLARSGRQPGLVKAISRSGDKSEALGGPFVYCVVLVALTLTSWRSAEAVVAITQMAVGDGLADIVGRRFGKQKWPWSERKSIAGSAAFVVGAFTASVGLVSWFSMLGTPLGTLGAMPLPALAARLLFISAACGAVELIELGDDNITVPAMAVALVHLLGK